MHGRWRVGLALGACGTILGSLAGCSSISGLVGTSPAPPTAPPLDPAPIPGAEPPPLPGPAVETPKARSPAPALKNTGTSWPAILSSLSGYGHWLLANPDPALVGNIATPGCAMYNLISRQAAGLLRNHTYVTPAVSVFGPVIGPSLPADTTAATFSGRVMLTVTVSRPGQSVISRTGTEVTSFAVLQPTAMRITLYLGADDKWRFCNATVVGKSGDPVDASIPLI